MSDHALSVLELDRVLESVASRAANELARTRLRSLRPSTDEPSVRRELGRVEAAMRFLREKPNWGMPTVPDVSDALSQMVAEGAVLEPAQLHRLGTLLAASRMLLTELEAREDPYEELASVRERLFEDRDAEEALERAVDSEGNVLDTASRELRSIRSRLKGAQNRIVKKLEAYLRTLDDRYVVPDASVTIREGRYVIPLRREGKGEVGGIVHDESHTGATVFVEPPMAIELMNQLRDLEREEGREIRRILGELTARLMPLRDALRGALDALVDFDTLHTRARVAVTWKAEVPDLLPPGSRELRLVRARHPLLVEDDERGVVPFDLSVEEGERALVVSGPNTGGKTVFLKAVGLTAVLAQCGVVPPVGKGTRLPVFGAFYADIGDEQSIARSLSTFSAHLENLSEIVEGADAESLVLIDEMGTGTDPAEGAALSRAILETLVERGAFSVVSSHLGELKRLDSEESGIVNASLQFDAEEMEPTYHLVKGRPGRSYGLAIARRQGFPEEVLDRAEGYRAGDEAHMEELLARLERQEREAEELVQKLEREKREAERLREEVEAREEKLQELERSADQRAREEARQVLMDARSEVEEAIRQVREAADGGEDLDEAATGARRRVEEAAREQERRMRERTRERTGPVPDLSEGDRVRVRSTGAEGRVTEVRAQRAMVEAGALRLELPLQDLEVLEAPEEEEGSDRKGGWTGPTDQPARLEVDFRGLRVDELDIELSRALDQAVLQDLSELRIIHGKGTGALRQRVDELLKKDGRVRSHRMGGPTEGGAGVTVASFGGKD